MKIIVLGVIITALACGCNSAMTDPEDKQYLDASGAFPLTVMIDSERDPRGVIYDGFKVDPIPGSRWSVRSAQNSRRALWGIVDESNRLHSIIGMVTLSDPFPVEGEKEITLQKFQAVMEKRFRDDDGGGRMKEIHYSSWIAERNGRQVVEFEGNSIDTGSKHAHGAPLKLFIRGFNTITESGRIFYAAVSERTPDLKANPDVQSTKMFLDAVSWEK